jgi:predicted permease
MDKLAADLRYAFRWLRRSPAFVIAAVASLGIGIAFNATIFAVVDSILLRPMPVRAPDRLVDIYTSDSSGDPWSTSSHPDFRDLRARNHVFTDLAGHSMALAAVKQGERTRLVLGEIVSANFFDVLGVPAAAGRMFVAADEEPGAGRVVIISHRYWRREFRGAPEAIGRALRIRNQPYTIVGVAPESFKGMIPMLLSELWVPASRIEEVEPAGNIHVVPSPGARTRLERRGYRWMFLKGRLKDGVTVQQAQADIDVLMSQLRQEYPVTNKSSRPSLKATKDIRLHPALDGPIAAVGAGLMIAVGLVLAIACANVASMLLARASARQKEISIRLAIGATRADLVRQLVVESLLLSLAGGLAGVLLAAWAIRAIGLLEPPMHLPLVLDLRLDARLFTFAFGVSAIAGLIAGLMPALKASRPSIVQDLRGGAVTAVGGRRWALRDGLVIGQMAVTVVLLVAAALLTRSLAAAQRADVGFRTDGLAIVSTALDWAGYDQDRATQFYRSALEKIRALPGVQDVALSSNLPFSINFSNEQIWVPDYHRPGDRGAATQNTRVSAEYFETIGIGLLEGRLFTGSDTPSRRASSWSMKRWPHSTGPGRARSASAYVSATRTARTSKWSAWWRITSSGRLAKPTGRTCISRTPSSRISIRSSWRAAAAMRQRSSRRCAASSSRWIPSCSSSTTRRWTGSWR